MTDIVVELPQTGEVDWGAKLNAALEVIVQRVNQNSASTSTAIGSAVADYLTAHPIASAEPLLAEHLADPTPHPVYDDMQSLTLIYENGLI